MAVENKAGNIAGTRRGYMGWWQRNRNSRTAYLYILPAGIVMSIITLYPLCFQVWMSFTDYGVKNLRQNSPLPNWVGLQNYTDILTGNSLQSYIPTFDFWRILIFNLWWAISNVFFHIIIGVLIAVLLNTEGLWFKRFYRAVYILPVVIPPLIVATVWKNIFDTDYGPINGILHFFLGPLGFTNIPWLEQSAQDIGPLPLAYFALLTANIWLGWPLNSVVATGALQSIPKDLYEAATVDGATGFQQLWRITVPLLRPAMLPFAVYGFITTFNLFQLSYFMSGGGPFGKTELLVTQVYKIVQTGNTNYGIYGIAAAFSVYMFIILLIISLITNRLTKATASNV